MSDPHQNTPEKVQAANRLAQAAGMRNMTESELAAYSAAQWQRYLRTGQIGMTDMREWLPLRVPNRYFE